MGLNAYFAYTVVIGMGYTWQYALTAVFAEGIIFILLSLTNVREAIFNAIPMNLKSAVSVGIGLFIAFVGLQNAHIVVGGSTLLQLFSVEAYNKANGVEASFNNVGITVILALAGIIITGILVVKKILKGNILWEYSDHMGTWHHLPVCRTLCTNPDLGSTVFYLTLARGFLFQVLLLSLKLQFKGIFSVRLYRDFICIFIR